jgi:thiamine biosynthesis lipoprotein
MLRRRQFRQMNGEVVVLVYSPPERLPEADRLLAAVERFFDGVERQFSRFRPDSELSALNGAAGNWFAASSTLFSVVALALRRAAATGGRFDPTILRALEAAGYDRSFEHLSDERSTDVPPAREPPPASYRQVRLDPTRQAIWLPPGTGIDLGGLVKGWAVDQAAAQLAAFPDRAVSAGGDMLVCGAPPGRDHWLIGVEDPRAPARDLLQLRLRDVAIATSGTRRRRWVQEGQVQHHLIDPATGQPARSDLLAVTAVAPTAVDAEVRAKVAFLQGHEHGAAYLEASPPGGVLVGDDGRVWITSGLRDRVQR